MIPIIVILGWCFVVACACVVGANKELSEITSNLNEVRTIASGLRGEVREAQRDKELAREKVKMLLQYVDTDREYRAFDDVLLTLPKGRYRGPRQHSIMEAKRFDLAAFNAVSEPCMDSMTVTTLAFDAMELHVQGREYTGWERHGWVIVPREALV